jgi:hypothetical protein
VGESGPRQARLPVVERAHGVEEVRHARRPVVEGFVGDLERRRRVPERDHHPASGRRLHERARAVELGGERDHAHRSQVQELGEQRDVRRDHVSRCVGPPLVHAQEGTFEVDAEHLRPAGVRVDRLRERRQGIGVERAG